MEEMPVRESPHLAAYATRGAQVRAYPPRVALFALINKMRPTYCLERIPDRLKAAFISLVGVWVGS